MTMIRSRKILDHARGQPCQLALPGICSHDPETTVFAHLNSGEFGKGMGMKAHDIAGCFSCFHCHAYGDVGHGTNPIMSDAELAQAWLRAVVNTWVILIADDVIQVPHDTPKPRTVKPRKPAKERTPIKSRQTAWPKRKFGQ